ncbi:tetratricopeptide repeat protein [Microvirga aerophila]|uniref:tetratricopeptide repeat protein n=1 Tax=Microvirga aerophila TaxID=670291 RepID=UPI0035A22267
MDDAEHSFRKALEVAREQEARMWELRAACDLAQMLRDHGRWAEARDLLAPIHGWFSEGFDVKELQRAKTLLDGLSYLASSAYERHRPCSSVPDSAGPTSTISREGAAWARHRVCRCGRSGPFRPG